MKIPAQLRPFSVAVSLATVCALASCQTSETSSSTQTTAPACPDPGDVVVEHHGFIEADETWGPGRHRVTSNVTVRPGVTLTLAPCAIVAVDKDQSILVDKDAKGLVAAGTQTQPVVVEPAQAGQPWGAITVYAPSSAKLAYTTLRGGGTSTDPKSADFAGATLVGRNQEGQPHPTLFVDHVTVEGSHGLGVLMDSTDFVAGSTALTVHGSGTFPVYLGAANATNLPVGTYTGNARDVFLLQSVDVAAYGNDDPVIHDATLPNRGLPYQVGPDGSKASIRVGDGREETPPATLTIEPGVELRFSDDGQLLVSAHMVASHWVPQGALVANGTAAQPITFTSKRAVPQPGDWAGLYFADAVAPTTSVSHAVIAYAGGESGSTGTCVSTPGASNYDADCAVILFLAAAPASQFLHDSTIRDSHACGVYRGWTGADIDFTATNTFSGLSGCSQSNVHDDKSGCVGACQ